MDINFELYKIFYHTAKEQSFSEAAQKLFISQSAVSQAIKNLEEKIGGQLFFRKTRSIRLTPEGEILFKHVEQAYNFIKSAEYKLSQVQSMLSGEIRIGVSDTICKYFLIPHLKKFNTLYPNVKIQVINRTSSQILGILKNGLIDFGIATLPVNDKSFSSEAYLEVEDIFVASNKFIGLKEKKLSLKELCVYPILLLEKNSSTRHNLDSFLNRTGIEIIPEIELESVDLLLEFAKIGIGISHVLRQSALSSIGKGELFEINIIEKLPTRKLGIVTINDVPLSHAAKEFIDMINK